MSEEILNQIIDETANKIISYLNESVKTTSWDIKIKLRLSSSLLYLALGYLVSQGKIKVYSKDLMYIVELVKSS